MSGAAFINRSLTTIRNELEFLKDSNVITERFYDEFTEKLPKKYQEGAPPVDVQPGAIQGGNEKSEYRGGPAPQANEHNAPTPPPPAQQEIVEALYDYHPQDPTDLTLRRGAKITVLEKLNDDWWKGRDMNGGGGEGIFPSNYVTKASDSSRGAPPPPPYGASSSEKGAPNFGYNPPPPQQMPPPPGPSNTSNYASYPPPSANYYPPPMQQAPMPAPPPPQPQPVEQQQQQQQPQEHGHMRKFGGKLGNAAIFGAGATMGSEIVHSIF